MSKVFFSILVSLALSLLLFRPLLNQSWYPTNDSTHISRVILLNETIHLGQFPAIWAHHINGGLGYPLFHFYAPLFHYLATLFAQFTRVTIALKVTLILTTALGILGVMQFARRWGRGAMLVGALAWGLSPYGALDLYVRGAYSEYLALSLLPWILLVFRSRLRPSLVFVTGLVFSLFIISHNLIPLLALPLILTWGFIHNIARLKLWFLALAITLGLSAWFLGPLIFERHFTHADAIAVTTDYKLHFVEPWQIWNSTWGYGGSAPGVEDGISFKLGKVQLLLSLFGLMVAIYFHRRSLVFLGIFAILFLFLATPSSFWIWRSLPFLSLLQFPWRALGIAAVLIAILTAYSVTAFRSRFLRLTYIILVSGSLINFNLKYFAPLILIPAVETATDIATVVPEYLPSWMSGFPQVVATPTARAYYPTWRVKIDGISVPTFPDESGLLSYSNALRSPHIELSQSHTPTEQFFYTLTVLTFVLALYYHHKIHV